MSRQISESIKVYIRERPDFHAGKPTAPSDENARPNLGLALGLGGPRGDSRGAGERGDRGERASASGGVQSISADRKSCVYLSANKTQQTFRMDRYFSPDEGQTPTQASVFAHLRPIVDSALLGYSGTILAYGPTGSGKTHTMRGGAGESRGVMA
ncbi:P-loop containing nucleoside triphosphate hydrolase protein, partial [Ochromonadaceae sp. CCMP2298]